MFKGMDTNWPPAGLATMTEPEVAPSIVQDEICMQRAYKQPAIENACQLCNTQTHAMLLLSPQARQYNSNHGMKHEAATAHLVIQS